MTMSKAVSVLDLNFAVVAGALASTNIAVTGITTDDTIIACQESAQTSSAPTNRTSTTSITSNGYIQCTDATDNDKLLVLWHDASAQSQSASCLKFALVAGDTATTDIAVTGIVTADTLLGCIEFDGTSGAPTDRTSEASITSDGNVQLTTTDTSGDFLLVCYHDASGQAIASPCLKWGQCNGSATTSTLSGIATEDKLLLVLELSQTDYLPTDRTSTTTISAANTLTNGATTENDKLLVLYHDASA